MSTAVQSVPKEFTYDIKLKADRAAVWKALTDAAELQRWFPLSAKVKPGVGGSILYSWGARYDSTQPIETWEPEHELRIRGWGKPFEGGPNPIAVHFLLSAGGRGETVLRVVHSGFGEGQKWSDYYDGISHGWTFELMQLKHYLEHHRGEERGAFLMSAAVKLPPAEAWSTPMSPGALFEEGLGKPPAAGATYKVRGPGGRTYSGVVLRSIPGRLFAATVRELNDGVLRIQTEGCGCVSEPYVWLAVWGSKRGEIPALRLEWQEAMQRVFPGAEIA